MKKKWSDKSYFILHSSCKAVRGIKRSVIIDYSRGSTYFISNQYYDLLKNLDRNRIHDVKVLMEDHDSIQLLYEFITTLLNNELGFTTSTISSFPEISNIYHDLPVHIQDMIIEIDQSVFDSNSFDRIIIAINDLKCIDLQIRLLSKFDFNFLDKLMSLLNHSNAHYIELHTTYSGESNKDSSIHLIKSHAKLANIFLYESPQASKFVITEASKLDLGLIFFIDYSFDKGNCCGIINKENLSFNSINEHNRFMQRNGCLDKKISIDPLGNIKNCPSLKTIYGNISNTSIIDLVKEDFFKKQWFITKDQISICKTCEFRYNCSDCRAFLVDEKDIYSKPLKCGYDPNTCEWNDDPKSKKIEGISINKY